jgi:hypothetical protein
MYVKRGKRGMRLPAGVLGALRAQIAHKHMIYACVRSVVLLNDLFYFTLREV